MSNSCKACEGCGKVSHLTGEPWNQFVGNATDQEVFQAGNDFHQASVCKSCGGMGVKRKDEPDALSP